MIEFKLKLNKTEVPLSFRFKTYRDYSLSRGIEMEEIDTELKAGTAFKSNEIPNILLFAHKTWCAYNGETCKQTELDSLVWMDELKKQPQTSIDLFYAFAAGYYGKTVEEMKNLEAEVIKANKMGRANKVAKELLMKQ